MGYIHSESKPLKIHKTCCTREQSWWDSLKLVEQPYKKPYPRRTIHNISILLTRSSLPGWFVETFEWHSLSFVMHRNAVPASVKKRKATLVEQM